MNTPDLETKPPQRVGPASTRRRRQPEDVRRRVLSAALNQFATQGYAGASTRKIASEASVALSLLLYHFQSKENLWRAVFLDFVERAKALYTDRPPAGSSAEDNLRFAIRHHVRLFAAIPDLHRLMTQEAHQSTDRLKWMCEIFIESRFSNMRDLIAAAQKEGAVPPVDPARLRYAITAMAAVPFAVSAEYQHLTDHDPFDPAEVDHTIAMIEALIFQRQPGQAGAPS